MELSVLDQLLEILRDHGVSRFENSDIRVEFSGAVVEAEDFDSHTPTPGAPIKVRPAGDTHARGIYANPSLWPGGEPPTFPKKST